MSSPTSGVYHMESLYSPHRSQFLLQWHRNKFRTVLHHVFAQWTNPVYTSATTAYCIFIPHTKIIHNPFPDRFIRLRQVHRAVKTVETARGGHFVVIFCIDFFFHAHTELGENEIYLKVILLYLQELLVCARMRSRTVSSE